MLLNITRKTEIIFYAKLEKKSHKMLKYLNKLYYENVII